MEDWRSDEEAAAPQGSFIDLFLVLVMKPTLSQVGFLKKKLSSRKDYLLANALKIYCNAQFIW